MMVMSPADLIGHSGHREATSTIREAVQEGGDSLFTLTKLSNTGFFLCCIYFTKKPKSDW